MDKKYNEIDRRATLLCRLSLLNNTTLSLFALFTQIKGMDIYAWVTSTLQLSWPFKWEKAFLTSPVCFSPSLFFFLSSLLCLMMVEGELELGRWVFLWVSA